MLDRRLVLFAAFGFAAWLAAPPSWAAEPAGAAQIMQAVDEFDDGDHMVADVELVLTDRQGTQQTKRFQRYMRNGARPRDKYSFVRFYEPRLLAGTTVLAYDYRDHRQDNDSWIYIPEIGKVKRLTSSERTGKLMGSDISYGDLTKRNIDNYDFALLGEVAVGEWRTWHIEFVPKTDEEVQRFGYLKGQVWVDKRSLRIVRSIFWKAENHQTKLFDVKKMDLIDGIWTPVDMVFATQHDGTTVHHTAMKFSSVRYNRPVADHLFTPEGMARAAGDAPAASMLARRGML